jgi:hypothetical protein
MKRAAVAVSVGILAFGLLAAPLVAGGRSPFVLGVGYQYRQSEWRQEGVGSGTTDMTNNMIYAQGAHPLVKGVWGFANIGIADLDFGDVEFDGDFKPYWTIGVSGNLESHLPVRVGPILQYTRFSDYDAKGSMGCAELEYKDFYEVYLGVELQQNIAGISVYGGPLAHWAKMSLEYDECNTFAAVPPVDLEDEGTVGAFIGFNYPIQKGLFLHLTGEYMSSFTINVSVFRVFMPE